MYITWNNTSGRGKTCLKSMPHIGNHAVIGNDHLNTRTSNTDGILINTVPLPLYVLKSSSLAEFHGRSSHSLIRITVSS